MSCLDIKLPFKDPWNLPHHSELHVYLPADMGPEHKHRFQAGKEVENRTLWDLHHLGVKEWDAGIHIFKKPGDLNV